MANKGRMNNRDYTGNETARENRREKRIRTNEARSMGRRQIVRKRKKHRGGGAEVYNKNNI